MREERGKEMEERGAKGREGDVREGGGRGKEGTKELILDKGRRRKKREES